MDWQMARLIPAVLLACAPLACGNGDDVGSKPPFRRARGGGAAGAAGLRERRRRLADVRPERLQHARRRLDGSDHDVDRLEAHGQVDLQGRRGHLGDPRRRRRPSLRARLRREPEPARRRDRHARVVEERGRHPHGDVGRGRGALPGAPHVLPGSAVARDSARLWQQRDLRYGRPGLQRDHGGRRQGHGGPSVEDPARHARGCAHHVLAGDQRRHPLHRSVVR